jgi:hypothetical protein
LILGLIFLGIVSGSVSVPIILELASAVKDTLGPVPGSSEKCSALFTFFGSLGIILSIILGGVFYQLFGNRILNDIFALLSLFMAILNFILNIKPGYLLPIHK